MRFFILKYRFFVFTLLCSFFIVSCSKSDDIEQEEPLLPKEPPFAGTTYVNPDIITSSDPTTFQNIVFSGRGERNVFDRRVNAWSMLNTFLFNVTYSDGITLEVRVNPEFFTPELAEVQAEKYSVVIGRLPKALRVEVKTVTINDGDAAFGGGTNNLLIHTVRGEKHIERGFLEEVLVHEASHVSLDPHHKDSPGWIASQKADGNFISDNAKDNPTREDIAASFLMYIAVRYRADRLPEEIINIVNNTIPNRIKYFDSLSLDMDILK